MKGVRQVGVASLYKTLLLRSALALLACVCLVTICFFFVDRPVAFWVHDHDLRRFQFLLWLQDPPPYLQAWAPAVLTALLIRRAWGPFRRWELTLLAACVSLLIAVQFKDSLKFCCGRYWPDTWIDNNPSLLANDAYGFHPFHGGTAYASFPSGHMTRTLSIAAVVWLAYPRWRWACIAAPVLVAIGLVGMNYHFVGDVIGGSFIGGFVGVYTAYACGVVPETVTRGGAGGSESASNELE
jgi:membrane-associated phospholipid phosphatase